MTTDTAAASAADLKHDLDRLEELGPDAVEAVAFRDIRHMGGPLAIDTSTRYHIYQLAKANIAAQLRELRTPA